MMKNSPGEAGPSEFRHAGRRMGMLQLLMRPVTIAVLAVGATAAACRAGGRQADVNAQARDEAASKQTQYPAMAENKHEDDEEEGHGNDAGEFSLVSLAKPTGILTLSLVALTVCLGVLRRAKRFKPGSLLKLHKITGVCALGSGVIHAAIVLLAH